jgi:hypothetical protein
MCVDFCIRSNRKNRDSGRRRRQAICSTRLRHDSLLSRGFTRKALTYDDSEGRLFNRSHR